LLKNKVTLEIGKYNTLKIVKEVDFGLYLSEDNETEILLPARYIPQNVKIGDEIEVFIYKDNEERLIATTDHPYGTIGEFRYLKVKEISDAGTFLDWGIMKDLLVPYREQKSKMEPGRYYLVYIYLDFVTKRITASERIDKFLDNIPPEYSKNQQVSITIANETDLGYKVIINNAHWGLLYRNEIFKKISKGEQHIGYIKEIREDDKIDVSLYPIGYDKTDSISEKIMKKLKENDGFLPIHDKSDASEIHELFSCSKKSFKMAIGALYKKRRITIKENGIQATKDENKI
jgi:predicted RNA-binding protein (virulence factor B family)